MLFLESYKTVLYPLFTMMPDIRGSKGVMKTFEKFSH